MSTSKLTIADDFPPVDYETWRRSVEADLGGAPFDRKLVSHTYEGIDIQPVYTSKDRLPGTDPTGLPGAAPFVRGAHPMGPVMCGVDIRQEHAHPDLKATNTAVLADLEGGVTSLMFRLDGAGRRGLSVDDPGAAGYAGRDGVMLYDVDDLDACLAKVHLELVDVTMDAGAAFLPAAALLHELWQRRGVRPNRASGCFAADPFATLAREGSLPMSIDAAMNQMAQLTRWTLATYPQTTPFPKVIPVCVDTSPYHDAGATAAQDIAFSMATAVEYLRGMTERGVAIDDAAKRMLFRFSLGTHHFLAIAKLRAARKLWSRILEASGAAPMGMRIHGRTSNRVMTQRDPYVNLLRNSVSVFAAMLGGAEVITSLPFDHASQLPDAFSRRIARNTVLVLQEESHLHRVLDPAGGSWFLEDLTAEVAEKAWSIFQDIERGGGMLTALQGGSIADQIDAAYAPRAKDIAVRKQGITGVSEFPNLDEERIAHVPPDTESLVRAAQARAGKKTAASESKSASEGVPAAATTGQDPVAVSLTAAASGSSLGQIAGLLGFGTETTEMTAIEPHAFAQPFEELRDASDAWVNQHGHRPKIFLANMGPVAHHTARATYAKNFFEAGGFQVDTNAGFVDADAAVEACRASGAGIAVICSSDKLYPDVVPPLASGLKAAGVRTVVLAGHPGEKEAPWREAGVDRFIYIKCDVLDTLRELLREEKVLAS